MADITQAKAYWFDRDTLLWNIQQKKSSQTMYRLYYAPQGGMTTTSMAQFSYLELHPRINKKNVPQYLREYTQFSLQTTHKRICELLRSQIAIASLEDHKITIASGLQTWGVIDDIFDCQYSLGISWKSSRPTLRIWAPTAKSVTLHLFDGNKKQILPTNYLDNGTWQICGESSWKNKFYLYEVEVIVGDKIHKNIVTDPYSISLDVDSSRSQIIDFSNTQLQPPGWSELKKPRLSSFSDISLYELHIRDFSINDHSTAQNLRGTYMAFTQQKSHSVEHLKLLAKNGLTHIHLLPIFDIATIPENRNAQKNPIIASNLSPTSEIPQQIISQIRDEDGFNWGYDPFHYGVPEGSYATNPHGNRRVYEVRAMVKSLCDMGLRVVMDVVYNHTHASGQNQRSVLDKIVPGYYYRQDRNGYVQNTSCCPDTASERKMMERLMIDTLVIWAKHYKIDGFRFDLMGHHTTENLQNIRRALDLLTLDKHGVDGKKIYLYGEGWTFGSLYDTHPQKVMNQINASGLGVGTFNDRLRDCARGGNFQHHTKSDQGFINGLFYDYNHGKDNSEITSDLSQQKKQLLNYADNIRISLVGALRDFPLVSDDKITYGFEIDYRGNSCGYTSEPYECINYISAHDNYTLWDQISAKAPFHNHLRTPNTATTDERIEMQILGLSLVLLGQGIPFIHAGSELARSKSGDGDSYNSGDWFNKLDFTYSHNNWGVGLPCKEKNYHEWEFWKPRLESPELIAKQTHILKCLAQFVRLLKLRYSSKLFRLPNAQEIIKRVQFLNINSSQPGVIVMLIDNSDLRFDDTCTKMIVAFNPSPHRIIFSHPLLENLPLKMHPLLLEEIVISVEGKQKRIPSLFTKSKHLELPKRSYVVYLQEK